MIGSLRGAMLDRRPRAAGGTEVLVEVAGVGYRVVAPSGPAGRLGSLGGPVFLHVHTHVREDAIVLYGFPTREERACFEALIGAHGVGPAVALAMLSVHSPAALQRAVEAEDLDALMLVPGIGKKTAARLVVELKERLDDELDLPGLEAVGGGAGSAGGGATDGSAAAAADVRAALAGLGYGADEIRQVMPRLPAGAPVEDQVRLALKEMAGAR